MFMLEIPKQDQNRKDINSPSIFYISWYRLWKGEGVLYKEVEGVYILNFKLQSYQRPLIFVRKDYSASMLGKITPIYTYQLQFRTFLAFYDFILTLSARCSRVKKKSLNVKHQDYSFIRNQVMKFTISVYFFFYRCNIPKAKNIFARQFLG